MNILFLHPNMPGQYKHLARAFGEEGGHRIFFVTKHKSAELPGVTRVTYRLPRDASPHTHRYLVNAERGVLQGQEVWRVCKQLRDEQDFVPDIIVAHPGWGDLLFIKEVFPTSRILSFFEFYYRGHGADVGFDPSDPMSDDDYARIRMKNTTNDISLNISDWGISPTIWQWSLHPKEQLPKISVIHDGVNTEMCRPNPQAHFTVPNGPTFKPGDEVVTYIARNFEPYRGFPTFMKAAELLLKRRPNCHIIAVGADEVSYGKHPPKGTTYRQILSKQVTLPADRIHFIGTLPYDQLITLFQVSAAHLYLTFPFVLSWSMLESMASGVALVASRTAPVLEVVEDGKNGVLADFFSPEDVVDKICQLLDAPDRNAAMRANARQTVIDRFDLSRLLPLHMQLVREVAAGQIPPPVAQEILRVSPVEPYLAGAWNGQ